MQAETLRFAPEKLGNQSFDHVGLDFFGKTLADNRRGNVAAAEAGNSRHLLIFLDQRVGLPVDVLDGNLNYDLAFGGAVFRRAFFGRTIFGLSGAHDYLSKTAMAAESGEKLPRCDAGAASLSVKTLEEQRQTAEGDVLRKAGSFRRRGWA